MDLTIQRGSFFIHKDLQNENKVVILPCELATGLFGDADPLGQAGVMERRSILVSGIGILSILLVSVVERTKEIGLRRSLGASKLSIIGSVLNESLIFVLFGAALGLVAAYFTA